MARSRRGSRASGRLGSFRDGTLLFFCLGVVQMVLSSLCSCFQPDGGVLNISHSVAAIHLMAAGDRSLNRCDELAWAVVDNCMAKKKSYVVLARSPGMKTKHGPWPAALLPKSLEMLDSAVCSSDPVRVVCRCGHVARDPRLLAVVCRRF